ncbi:MAG: DUF2520 domain-containing protein [Syntrophales bacterium]|nr:DUF2520 domain-containing protein [Syntrophales bacterium]
MKTSSAHRPSAAFIGLGKVGTALACSLHDAGYAIRAVHDPRPDAMERAARHTGARRCGTAEEAAGFAEMVFLSTPDDRIEEVCRRLADAGAVCSGKRVLHLSGACGLDLLAPARRCGAVTGCIHPLQSFPDVDAALRSLPGSAFGLTVEDALKEEATALIAALGGFPMDISDSDKPLYHAAACIASNYLVTLIDAVRRICESFGLSGEEAIRAFWPLITGTLRNIETNGTVASLSGPIERGDAGTVERHLEAMARCCPDLLPLYRHLGLLTADVAACKNPRAAGLLEPVREILSKE